MSTLQDFATMKLQPPGQLGDQPGGTAPVAPPLPVAAPTDVPMVQPQAPNVTPQMFAAKANEQEPPADNLSNPHAILRAEEKDERRARVDSTKAYGLQVDAANQKAKLVTDEATAAQPLLNQHTQQIEQHAARQQQLYNQMDAAGQKSAADYAAQIDGLSAKMANQPKDMFGRAGVNKVEGIIGLILGGLAGGATGGKNAAVERLNQLTQQKMAQDRYEYEMLGKRADMSTNLYAQLRQSGMDHIAAENAQSVAQTDSLLAQMKARENSFVPSKAKADLQDTIAQLQQQRTQFLAQGQQHRYGQAMHAYQLIQKDRELQQEKDAAAQSAKVAAVKLPDVNPLAGAFNLPQNFAKDNPKQVEQLGNKLENLKAAFEIAKHYDDSSFIDHSARASDRLEFSHRSAMFDTGSNTVRKVNVVGTDREAGSSPGLIPGTQTGMTDFDVTGRMKHGLAKRAQVLEKTIRDIGGGASMTPETQQMIKEINAFSRGYETDEKKAEAQNVFKKGTKRESLQEVAQRLRENRPANSQYTFPSGT